MVEFRQVAPDKIEEESFRIIEEGLARLYPDRSWPEAEFSVLRRIIHACGDLEMAPLVRFHPEAVERAVTAIRQGLDVVVDVNMALQGVSSRLLSRFGGKVRCHIASQEAEELAAKDGITRAEAGMEIAAADGECGIVAIGNAPTALIRVVEMVRDGRFRPAVVIGMPVGFVNAAESKEFLQELGHPYMTIAGTKGGTPAAVAAVNAVIRLAAERP